MTAYTIVSTALFALTLLGCVVFIVDYRPLNLRHHGPAGAHLLSMSWCLTVLYGMTLLLMVIDLPLWVVHWLIAVPIFTAICAVVWQREWLNRRVKNGRIGPVRAEREPTRTDKE